MRDDGNPADRDEQAGFPLGACAKRGQKGVADEFYAPIIPLVIELHRQGLSLRGIGRELDRRQIRTPTIGYYYGTKKLIYCQWGPAQVRRILLRGQRLAAERAAIACLPAVATPVPLAPPPPPSPPAPLPQGERATPSTPSAQTPSPSPPAPLPIGPANIRLWIGGGPKGPYSHAQVKSMLHERAVTLATHFQVDTSVWRPLSSLFGEAAAVKQVTCKT